MFKTVPLYTDISPEMSFPFVSRLINATAASQLAIIVALLSTLRFTRLGLQEMKKSVARRRTALFSFRLHVVIQQISYRTSPSTRAAAETVINATAENNLV